MLIVVIAGAVAAVWIVLAAVGARRKARLRSELSAARGRRDWATMAACCRQLLEQPHGVARGVSLRWALAFAEGRLGRHEAALGELGLIRRFLLSARFLSSLDNSCAYHLGFLRRTDEALVLLDRAEALLAGDGVVAGTVIACVHGTRGIVLFHGGGDLAEARAQLERALALQPHGDAQRMELDAERHYWLAAIATAASDDATARAHLQESAAFADTEFGAKAAEKLRGAQAR